MFYSSPSLYDNPDEAVALFDRIAPAAEPALAPLRSMTSSASMSSALSSFAGLVSSLDIVTRVRSSLNLDSTAFITQLSSGPALLSTIINALTSALSSFGVPGSELLAAAGGVMSLSDALREVYRVASAVASFSSSTRGGPSTVLNEALTTVASLSSVQTPIEAITSSVVAVRSYTRIAADGTRQVSTFQAAALDSLLSAYSSASSTLSTVAGVMTDVSADLQARMAMGSAYVSDPLRYGQIVASLSDAVGAIQSATAAVSPGISNLCSAAGALGGLSQLQVLGSVQSVLRQFDSGVSSGVQLSVDAMAVVQQIPPLASAVNSLGLPAALTSLRGYLDVAKTAAAATAINLPMGTPASFADDLSWRAFRGSHHLPASS